MTAAALPASIVDSHFHLFRRADVPNAGLLAAQALQRDFLWPDFEAAWHGLPVKGGLMVQVRDESEGVAEAGFVTSIAIPEPRLRGLVAGNLLEDPARRGELATLREVRLVRGIRRGTQFHPDPGYLARPPMIEGFRELGRLGLVGEVCVKHFQLEGVVELAKECRETTIVLDHLGKPEVGRQPQPVWEAELAELAERPNVRCKVSVVVQTPDDPPLDPAAMAPLIKHAVRVFGWERVIFGSNWPVSTTVIGYRDWLDLVLESVPPGRPAQLDALFAGNAVRTWRL